MTTTTVTTDYGDVRVANIPVRTTYYRGHYYRTHLTVSTTGTGFQMITRVTFAGYPDGSRRIAWYMVAPNSMKTWYHNRCNFI
jgi:hypothetical protein